jgi:hypothetical protein
MRIDEIMSVIAAAVVQRMAQQPLPLLRTRTPSTRWVMCSTTRMKTTMRRRC